MYPDFHFLFKELFGIDIPFLGLFKTFGFLVALGFLAAGLTLYKELYRKEVQGLLQFTTKEERVEGKAPIIDYLTNALLGFVLGYKIVPMFLHFADAIEDPLNYLTSSPGNWMYGIVGMLLFVGIKYYSNQKKTVVPGVRKYKVYPRHRVGDIAVIAAVGGFAGAKIFNAFETWEQFIQDPIDSLLSSSGLTFYGGLIVATIALWIYARRIKLDFRYLCDAAAPGLILAYGIGRLGCQISGDGDWGIYNSAYTTNDMGKVVYTVEPFESQVRANHEHVYRHFSKDETIPHKFVKGPDFLPTWLFAYNYPHNVHSVGVPLKQCKGRYCAVLPIPVFPTPVYEFGMSLIIFGILWRLRRKMKVPLGLFSIYLIFNGVERFFIEQIRVNYKYDWGFMQPTQAEIIAVCIVLAGIILLLSHKKIDHFFRHNESES